MLGEIAPVQAVRGNNDEGLPAFARLPETALVQVGALTLLLVDVGARDRRSRRRGRCSRGTGRSWSSTATRTGPARVGDTLFVNPGSAGRGDSRCRARRRCWGSGTHGGISFFDLAGGAPRRSATSRGRAADTVPAARPDAPRDRVRRRAVRARAARRRRRARRRRLRRHALRGARLGSRPPGRLERNGGRRRAAPRRQVPAPAHLVLLDGIGFGGLNLVDLDALAACPAGRARR